MTTVSAKARTRANGGRVHVPLANVLTADEVDQVLDALRIARSRYEGDARTYRNAGDPSGEERCLLAAGKAGKLHDRIESAGGLALVAP